MSTDSDMMDTSPIDDPVGRWSDIEHLLSRRGPLAAEGFEPDTVTSSSLKTKLFDEFKVLVIGAGGLGCELLKDLALMGFRNIDVVDMDTIDVSNLNRQFLFREQDVGKPKADVAAAFINQRVVGCRVNPYFGKIQDKSSDYYAQFDVIVCGLDSIEARRWINAMIVSLVDVDDDGNPDATAVIPIVDGGTEGFKGHARVILPRFSSCFECMLPAFPPQEKYPICTIALTPRLPEHCIEWASQLHWPKHSPFKDAKGAVASIDTDNPEHMKWLYEAALERANEYDIQGVTYKKTQGVVKNIIPAVASTNAVIAAACTTEVFKIATNTADSLDNYLMLNGVTGTYSHTFNYEQREDCPVCGVKTSVVEMSADATVKDFFNKLCTDTAFRFKNPGLSVPGKVLYMPKPQSLERQTRKNLAERLDSFVQDGNEVDCTDETLAGVAASIRVRFINNDQ
eukprot:CAMPEP_0177665404 /NCGR_PEP_ID=MMETSP0447-20121125/21034_1 /TAXON_ID=0 /ORGANISM="Stygamoeba regulata, Strain BSH-02190019" /LENGTH=453 /DNA_ID=CAMNT_0019171491 /DNA_START=48 /DNA_END=1409 /DNA_ORIENTATION=+